MTEAVEVFAAGQQLVCWTPQRQDRHSRAGCRRFQPHTNSWLKLGVCGAAMADVQGGRDDYG